jgi:acyl carrier protein
MTASANPSDSGPAHPGTSGRSTARDPLARFPAAVREAHAHYRATGDPDAVDTVVLAVIRDFLPRKVGIPAEQPLPDHARLMQDLGYDSLAIAETVFFLEDLYPVSIRNEEILELSTVGDLRTFVRRKLAGVTRSVSPDR